MIGFGLMDTLFPIMFMLVFTLVIGMFIFTAVSGLKTWNKNNNSPRLTVDAKVVSKRMNVTHHSHAHGDRGKLSFQGTRYLSFERTR